MKLMECLATTEVRSLSRLRGSEASESSLSRLGWGCFRKTRCPNG
jgi:hypothetical protein